MKKFYSIILLALTMLVALPCEGQSIKAAADQAKRQQAARQAAAVRQQQIQARMTKAELSYAALALLVSKDLEYTDSFLKRKGWTYDGDRRLYYIYGVNTDITPNNSMSVLWEFDADNDGNEERYVYYIPITNDEHAVMYVFLDTDRGEEFKEGLEDNGYYLTDEGAYRKDSIEINTTSVYECSAFYAYNYVKFEARKAAEMKAKREQRERDSLYRATLSAATTALNATNYEAAKEYYAMAASMRPADSASLSDVRKKVEVLLLCRDAKYLYDARSYNAARDLYSRALAIAPNQQNVRTVITTNANGETNVLANTPNQQSINRKIYEIDSITHFLALRPTTVFDYHVVNPQKYEVKNKELTDKLIEALKTNGKNVELSKVKFEYDIDSMGVTKPTVIQSMRKGDLFEAINAFGANLSFEPLTVYGYHGNSQATFEYAYSYKIVKIKVTKNATYDFTSSSSAYYEYKDEIEKALLNKPRGMYQVIFIDAVVNGQHNTETKVLDNDKTGVAGFFQDIFS